LRSRSPRRPRLKQRRRTCRSSLLDCDDSRGAAAYTRNHFILKIEKQKTEPSSLIIDASVDLSALAIMESIADRLRASSFGGPDTDGWRLVRDISDSIRALKIMVEAVQKDELRNLLSVKPRPCASVPGVDANALQNGARLIVEAVGIENMAKREPSIAGIMAPALAVGLDSLLSDQSANNELSVCKSIADALRAAAKLKKA